MSDTEQDYYDDCECASCYLRRTRRELSEARAVLERCRTVLGNMALENEGAIFNRWPINHEPLRNDARHLLPLIDAILAAIGEGK